MWELLWLAVPAAAASGWYAARWASKIRFRRYPSLLPDEYIKGLNFLLNEQPDKALEVFIRIVEVDSETIETHIVLGILFRRRGEVDRAIRIHQNLVARPNLHLSQRGDALLELGRDYLRAGLLDRAEELFKELIQIGKQTAPAYRHLREVYEQEKEWEHAIESAIQLQRHCRVSQANVIAHYYCELGESEVARGRQGPAVRLARKALAYDSDCARASILLGDLAFANSNFRQAIKLYTDVHKQKREFLPLVLPKLELAFARDQDQGGYLKFLQRVQGKDHGVALTLSLIERLNKRGDSDRVDEVFAAELSRSVVSLRIIKKFVQAKVGQAGTDHAQAPDIATLESVAVALDAHLARQASHVCGQCGLETKSLFWQCPSCHAWGSITPIDQAAATQASLLREPLKTSNVTSIKR